MDFPSGSDSKASAYNVGDLGLIPGLGRSPGEENGNPLQYSCLENPMDRGAWWAVVHGVMRVGHDFVTKPRRTLRIDAHSENSGETLCFHFQDDYILQTTVL